MLEDTRKKITKLKFHVQENIDDDDNDNNNDGISFWCTLAHSLSPLPKNRRRNYKMYGRNYKILSQNHRDPVRYRLHKKSWSIPLKTTHSINNFLKQSPNYHLNNTMIMLHTHTIMITKICNQYNDRSKAQIVKLAWMYVENKTY